MNRNIAITALVTLMAIVAVLSCSVVWAADSRQVWLGNSLVLRVRNGAGGYTVAQRVNALQLRANDLLPDGSDLPRFSVRKSGVDSNIYANRTFFMTVSAADGRANGSTSAVLAGIWARRLRMILPNITMYKPGVGRPGQVGNPGNAVFSRARRVVSH